MITDKHFTEFITQAQRVGKERLQLCSSCNQSILNPDDLVFSSPLSMSEAIKSYCIKTRKIRRYC